MILKTSHISKGSRFVFYIAIVLLPIVLGVSIGKFGLVAGLVAIILAVGLPIVGGSLLNAEFGLLTIVTYSFFMALLDRITMGKIPVGVAADFLVILVVVGIIARPKQRDTNLLEYLKHPIIILFSIDVAYAIIQVLNPNAMNLKGWFVEFRFAIYKIGAIFLLLNIFQVKKEIYRFFKLVMILSLLAAIYGIYHEYFGLFSFENAWLHASPVRLGLIVIFGNIRIWSFLAGPAEFGLMMAYSSVFMLVLTFGKGFSLNMKISFLIAAVLMMLGMVFSGTRTAIAVFPAGIALYFLMTLNKIRTVVISVGVILLFGIIYFGPFYSPSVIRLRSAFEGSDDPSMNVRQVNRSRIQPYIYKHIIGGGPGTTNDAGLISSPGHPLAGFPTDSYYLRVALEKGLPGLFIIMLLFVVTIIYGINSYYTCRDPILKSLCAALVCSFFTICLSNYTQEGISFRPMDILVLSTYVLVIKIRKLDDKNRSLT